MRETDAPRYAAQRGQLLPQDSKQCAPRIPPGVYAERERPDLGLLYKPEMLAKIIEIYRFHHNWMGTRQTTWTPAMKLGLAKGRIYERDLFGE